MTKSRKPLKVLLADDERAVANLYSNGLIRYLSDEPTSPAAQLECELFASPKNQQESATAVVVVCRQGQDAVELAKEAFRIREPFDVIVLDIRMPPGIDGVEAARLIRSIDGHVPIIFLSAYSDLTSRDIERRVPPAELTTFLSKPIRMSELAAKIRGVFESR